MEISHLEKGYGERTLIHDFSYIFLKNDRVAFIGANGCGKTTLMKMLTGKEQPDAGGIVVGQTVKIGYYAQEVTHMDPQMRVIDYIDVYKRQASASRCGCKTGASRGG